MGNCCRRSFRITGTVIIAIGIILAIIWARAVYGARDNYYKGEAFLKEGQTIRAVTFFDRSIHWYTPLNPYVQQSAEKLWEIGLEAEKTGDKRLALIAYESIKNGFYGATHLVTPGKHWIGKVDSKIAGLTTGQAEKGQASELQVSPGESPYPAPIWSLAVVIGFLGWIGSLIGLIAGPFRHGEMRSCKGFTWLGVCGLCFILWILGMVKA